MVLPPWSPKEGSWESIEPKQHVLLRKTPSMLNVEEMVISLKTQCYGGGRRRTPMGDGLDLFLLMTRRFRKGPNGWKPGYSFELMVRICLLTEPSTQSWDQVSGGSELCSWRSSSRIGAL